MSAPPPSRPSIHIWIAPGPIRDWIPRLQAKLEATLGAEVRLVVRGEVRHDRPSLFETLERRLRHASAGAAVWVATPPPASTSDENPDLIVDATMGAAGCGASIDTAPVLRAVFDGMDGSTANLGAWAATGRLAIGVTLRQPGEDERPILDTVTAVPEHELLTAALDTVFSRVGTLIVRGAVHVLRGTPLPEAMDPPPPTTARARSPLRGYWAKGLRQFSKRFVRRGDWGVAVRSRMDEEGLRAPALSLADYEVVESPRDRFYADPILLEHQGETYLLLEDFDYAAGWASLSWMRREDAGWSAPQPLLNTGGHLSYPFVLEHEGAIYMVPESSAAGEVVLYRADPFPTAWTRVATLLEGVSLADATLHLQAETGRWWLFGSMSELGESGWDTLSLFMAEDLHGPWRPHPSNPVKCDARSSRPAGPLLWSGGRLLRPTQDCSNGYGGALTWCEIVELTPDRFSERPVATQRFDAASGVGGPHTYSRATAYEAVDFKRTRRR